MNDTKHILLVNSSHEPIAGAEVYTLALYKNLIKKGHTVRLLVAKASPFQKQLQNLKIPHHTYRKFVFFKLKIQPGLRKAIHNICKTDNIQIIHCNAGREVIAAKKVATQLAIKTALTLHVYKVPKTKYMQQMDGIISVHKENSARLQKRNTEKTLGVKQITHIPPFFDSNKFEHFNTKQTKQEFYKKEFGITLKNIPVLCTIARLHKDKNIPLQLHALHTLIYKKNTPVHMIFAGSGPCEKEVRKLAKKLALKNYVHFLGNTNHITDILFHSDIKILASRKEGCGISLLEAALLKKPLIGATNTGMTSIIQHKQTGLLFENGNEESLVQQIETLLSNPDLGKTLGQNAYHFVKKTFNPEKIISQMEELYEQIHS